MRTFRRDEHASERACAPNHTKRTRKQRQRERQARMGERSTVLGGRRRRQSWATLTCMAKKVSSVMLPSMP